NDPEPRLPRLPLEAFEALSTTQIRSDCVVVRDVVTVRAARRGLVDRRQIKMTDPQSPQIRENALGVAEGEIRRQLKPVRAYHGEGSDDEVPCEDRRRTRFSGSTAGNAFGTIVSSQPRTLDAMMVDLSNRTAIV